MLGAKLGVSDYLSRVCDEIQRLDPAQIEKVSELIEAAYDEGRFVFIIGNGGSGANASHLCEDLAKCTLRDFENQKRLQGLEPDRQHRGNHGLGQRRGLRPHLRRATEKPCLARRPAAGDFGFGQQSQHPQGRLLGQRTWPDDGGVHRVFRRQAQEPGPLQPARGHRRHGDR